MWKVQCSGQGTHSHSPVSSSAGPPRPHPPVSAQGAVVAGGWGERSAGGTRHGPGTAAATVPEGEGLGQTGTEGAAWSAETDHKEK